MSTIYQKYPQDMGNTHPFLGCGYPQNRCLLSVTIEPIPSDF